MSHASWRWLQHVWQQQQQQQQSSALPAQGALREQRVPLVPARVIDVLP